MVYVTLLKVLPLILSATAALKVPPYTFSVVCVYASVCERERQRGCVCVCVCV